ncbi:MAG: hypothetical protein AAF802_13970 [Planctomycetota bacterium]
MITQTSIHRIAGRLGWHVLPSARRLVTGGLLALVAWILAPAARGQSVADLTTEDLAQPSYSDRQRATLEMWRQRDQFRQIVQDAARNGDPEVAQRAGWILRQWRSGRLPGIAEALDESSSGIDPIALVLEQGAFDAVKIAVEESAGTIDFDQFRDRVSRLLMQRYPIYISSAVEQNSEVDLLELMWSVASDPAMVIAAVDLSKRLDLAYARPLELALASLDETPRQLCVTQLAMRERDLPRALAAASKTKDPAAIRVTQMLAGRWDLVTEDATRQTKQLNTPSELAEIYAWMLIGATRDDDVQAQAVAKRWLSQSKPASASDEFAQMIRWRALAINSMVDEAIKVLAENDPAKAGKVAWASSRIDEGMDVLGFPSHRIELDLDEWINEAYRAQSELPPGQMADGVNRLYSLARLVYKIGRQDLARKIYDRLAARDVIVGRYGETMRVKTIEELDRIRRMDWLLDVAVSPRESPERGNIMGVCARALDVSSATFKVVYDRVKMIHRRAGSRECFRMTFQLFQGETPSGIDPQADLDRLFELLTHNPQLGQTPRGMAQVERVILNDSMLEMFSANGRLDLAQRGRRLLAESGNQKALIQSAEQAMMLGENVSASAFWSGVEEDARRFTATRSVITLDQGLSFAKARVGRWLLARRSGHEIEAARHGRVLSLMASSPSARFRRDLAEYLDEVEEPRFAAEIYRDVVIDASYGNNEAPDFFQTAFGYVGCIEQLMESDSDALKDLGIDPIERVRWSDLAVLDLFRNDRLLYDSIFVTIPLTVRKTMLEYAIETDDQESTKQIIKDIEQFDPLDIDFGERLLPEVRKAGMGELADGAFDRLFQRGLAHLEVFGTDAMVLNNLAWTGAMYERELEQSLKLSERAVFLVPDSVIYRDTLAELLFLLNQPKQALEIEQACVIDQPDEWHLYEQIEKYRAAVK